MIQYEYWERNPAWESKYHKIKVHSWDDLPDELKRTTPFPSRKESPSKQESKPFQNVITDVQREEVITLHRAGLKYREISEKVGIGLGSVARIILAWRESQITEQGVEL